MITSTANARVKQVVQWQGSGRARRRDKVFAAEGVKMFEEAPPDRILEVYVSEDMAAKADRKASFWEKLQQSGYETVASEVFARMSDTRTPQGILTVLRQPAYAPEEVLARENPLFLVLENLQDPGNLGTIVRTGEGAGVTGIIMSAQTVDIFNPKVIRSTMGSIYRVPFFYAQDLQETLRKMRGRGVHIYAACMGGTAVYDELDYGEPTAFLIGNEGQGLKEGTASMAERYLRIPMEGQVESLNAAVASALLIYEAYRQRRRQ